MLAPMWESRRTRFFALIGLSLILLQLKLFFFFFVVPLHVLYRKNGRRDFLIASFVVMAAFVAFMVMGLPSLGDPLLRPLALMMEFAVPVMFLAGIYVMLDKELIRVPGIYRYLLALVGPGFIGFLVFARIFAYQPLVDILQEEWSRMGGLFASAFEVSGGDG